MSRDCKGVINSLPSLMLHAAECPIMQRKVKKSNTAAAEQHEMNVKMWGTENIPYYTEICLTTRVRILEERHGLDALARCEDFEDQFSFCTYSFTIVTWS